MLKIKSNYENLPNQPSDLTQMYRHTFLLSTKPNKVVSINFNSRLKYIIFMDPPICSSNTNINYIVTKNQCQSNEIFYSNYQKKQSTQVLHLHSKINIKNMISANVKMEYIIIIIITSFIIIFIVYFFNIGTWLQISISFCIQFIPLASTTTRSSQEIQIFFNRVVLNKITKLVIIWISKVTQQQHIYNSNLQLFEVVCMYVYSRF
eukprot:TRINITY_DN4182_c0_g1_i12.p1 TRINITY_DN4182_c0_g1~~TRINITY_DN4182_c0_g1_i12.p1  ORF type:complete len:206 (-),score=-22.20 TRINITY_DN4182_c0_g1_i12:79-696(-)